MKTGAGALFCYVISPPDKWETEANLLLQYLEWFEDMPFGGEKHALPPGHRQGGRQSIA